MSKAKQLRKRIKSVKNTRKITKTMEMVAASKMKRAQDRVVQARPYTEKLMQVMGNLTGAITPEIVARFPLLERREPVKRVLVFLLSADRGLCGAYNSNVIRRARLLVEEEQLAGKEVALHIAGRKGLSFFRFRKFDIAGSYTGLPDRPSFADAERFTEIFREAFEARQVDEVKLVYSRFASPVQQIPTVVKLLPIEGGSEGGAAGAQGEEGEAETKSFNTNFEFDPSPEGILGKLFPLYLRNTVYQVMLNAVASEHSARRIAMKNATDNADDMVRSLTKSFNKARQAQITQEIAEIVSGAAAVE